MAADVPQVAIPPLPRPEAAPPRTKLRLRFRKAGDLRLVSHHDLMKCFERMLRRAELPFRVSEGFHPHPKMVFPLSLALGVIGREEILELELEGQWEADEVQRRLGQQTPAGIDILSCRGIDPRLRGQVRRAVYRVALPPDRRDLAEKIATLLAASHAWVNRTRPQPRRLDVRPYLHQVNIDGEHLEISLWITPTGTARPDEIMEFLGLADVLASGAVLERSVLELVDEAPADHGPAPVPASGSDQEEDEEGTGLGLPAPESKPGSRGEETPARPTSLFPGPMSFDT